MLPLAAKNAIANLYPSFLSFSSMQTTSDHYPTCSFLPLGYPKKEYLAKLDAYFKNRFRSELILIETLNYENKLLNSQKCWGYPLINQSQQPATHHHLSIQDR